MNDRLRLSFVDLSYIDPFVDQSCYVMERMFGWTISYGRPRAKTDWLPTHTVTALLQLYGEVEGRVGLSLPSRLACLVATRMLQRDVLSVGEAVSDAVGELANTVVGRASACLGQGGIRVGLPQVTVGRQKKLEFAAKSAPLTVEMDTGEDAFTLEFGLTISAERGAGDSRNRPTGKPFRAQRLF
jgi:CheY-specific phosphatase CheX